MAVAAAMAAGSWSRLKVCRAADCRWAFVDTSRNSSRHWCNGRVRQPAEGAHLSRATRRTVARAYREAR